MRLVTLLSAGLDSVVATAVASREHEIVLALTFNYGQHAGPREIAAAQQIAQALDIEHAVVALPWLGQITHSAL
ncbi:MAG: 7-cyano-7-deazaguanine synthase, partial [Armatimonadetes bacterium]|nr:7-cyano-7-deazaguanine synthase [Armatimonadota bacterium]